MSSDKSFLAWVASKTNGANVHDSNMLRSNYEWFCRQGDSEAAEKTRRLLTVFLNSGQGRVRSLIGTNNKSIMQQFQEWEAQKK